MKLYDVVYALLINEGERITDKDLAETCELLVDQCQNAATVGKVYKYIKNAYEYDTLPVS